MEPTFDFGEAIKQLKAGNKVQRLGWNGKGMYLYLVDTLEQTNPAQFLYEPFIVMFTAQGKHQPGWLASQADMLAEDWLVVR